MCYKAFLQNENCQPLLPNNLPSCFEFVFGAKISKFVRRCTPANDKTYPPTLGQSSVLGVRASKLSLKKKGCKKPGSIAMASVVLNA